MNFEIWHRIFIDHKYLDEQKIYLPPPKGIILSAETFNKYQRVLIESLSGSKVYNRFGCREVGLIASE